MTPPNGSSVSPRELPLSASLVVDSGQLVEMELRKRALESELKRTKMDDKSLPTSGNHSDQESLELRLRQRAMLSFLAKKESIG